MRIAQIAERLGLSASATYKLISADGFPPPAETVGTIKFWKPSDIDIWKRNRVDGRRFNGRKPKRQT